MQSRECLSQEEVSQLSELLIGYHEVFSLEEGEQGETDFKIDTGDATPKRQTYRRIPFAARQEIANQLDRLVVIVIVLDVSIVIVIVIDC